MFVPVTGGAVRISSDFGMRTHPITGDYKQHGGIDFAAPMNAPVMSAGSGRVIFAGYGGGYGNLVKIQHDDGSVAYYAHLNGFTVRRGERIRRGTPIGRVGATGNSTGPHLHFGVKQYGRFVDPRPWLSGRPGNTTERFSTSETVRRDNSALLAALDDQEAMPQAAPSTPGGGFPGLGAGQVQRSSNPLSLERMLGEEDAFRKRAESNFDLASLLGSAATKRPASNYGPFPMSTTPRRKSGNPFERLIRAIRSQESGGSYRVVNRSSGALGAYQIMPANLPQWSREALGYSITPQQFLRDPSTQDKIARYKLGQYYSQYGASGAALAWYAGPGALKYSSATLNRPQGKYPSMNEYIRDVLAKAGL